MADYLDIGRANAEVALDQVGSYDDLQDALDTYAENLWDTLRDMKASQTDQLQAIEGFRLVLVEHNISHRPMGIYQ